jgi:hypothetical protein
MNTDGQTQTKTQKETVWRSHNTSTFQNKKSRLKRGLKEIGWGGMKWIQLAQQRDQWRALTDTVMNLLVP